MYSLVFPSSSYVLLSSPKARKFLRILETTLLLLPGIFDMNFSSLGLSSYIACLTLKVITSLLYTVKLFDMNLFSMLSISALLNKSAITREPEEPYLRSELAFTSMASILFRQWRPSMQRIRSNFLPSRFGSDVSYSTSF